MFFLDVLNIVIGPTGSGKSRERGDVVTERAQSISLPLSEGVSAEGHRPGPDALSTKHGLSNPQ